MKRILLLGQGSLAVRIAQYLEHSSGFNLIGVLPSLPSSKYQSVAAYAHTNGIRVWTPEELDHFEAKSIDIGLSVYFDQILDSLQMSKFGRLLNLHNSPLPKYRGCLPINWALERSEDHHGVTIHEIDSGVDTGPILGQTLFDIYPGDEVIDVYQRCLAYAWPLVCDVLENLDSISPRIQNGAAATYFSRADSVKLEKFTSLSRRRDIALLDAL
jgi:methionyl-tRNA formyltransferase